MRGRVNMPPDAVLALVLAVKTHQKELRDHSKLDSASGWTVRNQTWKIITDELNVRYGRELAVDQCMKKFLNIKTMVKYKLEEETRKRQQTGFENFLIRFTPAEQLYLRLFRGIIRGNGGCPQQQQMQQQGTDHRTPPPTFVGLKEEEEEEEERDGSGEQQHGTADEPPPTMAMLLAKDSSSFQRDFGGSGGSVTEALLDMIPGGSQQQKTETFQRSEFSMGQDWRNCEQTAPMAAPILEIALSGTSSSIGGEGGGISAIVNSTSKAFLNNDSDESGQSSSDGIGDGQRQHRKRGADENGTGHLDGMNGQRNNRGDGREYGRPKKMRMMAADGEEAAADRRLKRLKIELIEMQKMEVMRREEWRLKKEFMLGRQTVALENMVILLREIRDKPK